MSYKAICLAICLLISTTVQLNLYHDVVNPIYVTVPKFDVGGLSISFRFSFPTSTNGAIGPAGNSSAGLTKGQFIGVAFPKTLGATLKFAASATSGPFQCSLTDNSNNQYMLKALGSAQGTINVSVAGEDNIAYCQLIDTSNLLPLKVGLGTIYTFTITLNSAIGTQYINQVSLFTATSNNPDKIIIDTLPFFGNIALYNDWTPSSSTKPLDFLNVNVYQAGTTTTLATINPYITFDLNIVFKVNSFISSADHLIVFQYPTDTVKAGLQVSSLPRTATTTDPLQKALTGSLGLKQLNSNSFYLDGVSEDLVINRQFQITIKGWTALDTNINSSKPIEVFVYYKNTFSVLSYVKNLIFNVVPWTLNSPSANHPENWNIYAGGAWPVTFKFTTPPNVPSSGGYVVIQHTNAIDITTGGYC